MLTSQRSTLTAAPGATVKITQIYITRDGLSADSDVENVKLLRADGVQVGDTAGGFNANHQAQVYITPALEITGSLDLLHPSRVTSARQLWPNCQIGYAVC